MHFWPFFTIYPFLHILSHRFQPINSPFASISLQKNFKNYCSLNNMNKKLFNFIIISFNLAILSKLWLNLIKPSSISYSSSFSTSPPSLPSKLSFLGPWSTKCTNPSRMTLLPSKPSTFSWTKKIYPIPISTKTVLLHNTFFNSIPNSKTCFKSAPSWKKTVFKLSLRSSLSFSIKILTQKLSIASLDQMIFENSCSLTMSKP